MKNQLKEPAEIYQKYQDRLKILTQQINYQILNYLDSAKNKITRLDYIFSGFESNLAKFQQMVDNNFQNIQFYLNNYIINFQKLIALNRFSDQYFTNQLANKLDNHHKNLAKVEKSITNIAIQNINEK